MRTTRSSSRCMTLLPAMECSRSWNSEFSAT